jgi:hypothetical protein
MAAFDHLFGHPSAGTTLAEGDLRHVMRRAQRLAQRGVQPAGVAGIRARAADQVELAREISEALQSRDVVRAQALIQEGAAVFGHAAMVASVEAVARQAQEDRTAEHYPLPYDIEDGWLEDEPR